MPLFMYLQTLSGLNAVYGRGADQLFMSACSLKICYRVNEHDTAKQFSDLVGEVEVERWSATETPQVTDTGRSYTQRSISSTADRMALIEPSELLDMETGSAIVIYRGEAARMAMPRYYEAYPMQDRANFGNISELSAFDEVDEAEEVTP